MAARQLTLRGLLNTQPRQSHHALRQPLISRTAPLARAYHPTARLCMAYTDDQDRNELKPRWNDSTKSGSDDELAEHSEAAFNPKITSPEQARESCRKESNGSPLDVSGANRDVSEMADENSGDKSDKKFKSSERHAKKSGKATPRT